MDAIVRRGYALGAVVVAKQVDRKHLSRHLVKAALHGSHAKAGTGKEYSAAQAVSIAGAKPL